MEQNNGGKMVSIACKTCKGTSKTGVRFPLPPRLGKKEPIMNKHLLCEDCRELVDECLCEEMLDQLESDDEDVYMEELLVSVEEQVEDDMMGKKEEV